MVTQVVALVVTPVVEHLVAVAAVTPAELLVQVHQAASTAAPPPVTVANHRDKLAIQACKMVTVANNNTVANNKTKDQVPLVV